MIDSSVTVLVLSHSRELHEAAMMHAEASRRAVCDNVEGDGISDCGPAAARFRLVFAWRAVRILLGIILPQWPRVTVVTPTWKRKELLLRRCVPSVRAQEYPGEIEHVIVSDGPDGELPLMEGLVMLREHHPFRNRGLAARLHGLGMATGDLIAYLDDDNAWRRQHLATLVRALEDTGADFAYSRALCHNPPFRYSIGSVRPACGQIDTSLLVHRPALLGKATWQPSSGPADWDLVRRWMESGARWAFVPEITLDYYVRREAVA